jgi:4-amino-4-deoxy-L-arabinose transferase-like glycosyltransferase
MQFYSKWTVSIVLFYLFMLAIVMHGACLGPDTYYYWQWSRHLDWSYYDGAPMIAYAMRLMTMLFGNGEFGLLSLGLLAAGITSFFLYRTAIELFEDEKVGFFAVTVWLTGLVTLRHFFLLITYDTTLIIFWAMTFYCFVRLIQTQKTRYFYYCGVGIGFMLLSKYTTVLLCAALLITCIVYKPYRFVFANKHFYFGLILSCILFSPVLYWNYLHHWASFSYQLNKGVAGEFNPLLGLRVYLTSTMINFNVYFIALVFIFFAKSKTIFADKKLAALAVPTLFVWLFFLFTAIKTVPVNGDSWNAECFLTASLLLGFYFSRYAQKWIVCGIILASCVPTLLYLAMSRFPAVNPQSGWSKVYAAKKLLQGIPAVLYQNQIIYHDGQYWFASFISYFLPGHPMVYSTDIKQGNQYYFWNNELHPAKSGEKIMVFSHHDVVTDAHFRSCDSVYRKTYLQENKLKKDHDWELNVFQCRYRDIN